MVSEIRRLDTRLDSLARELELCHRGMGSDIANFIFAAATAISRLPGAMV